MATGVYAVNQASRCCEDSKTPGCFEPQLIPEPQAQADIQHGIAPGDTEVFEGWKTKSRFISPL